MLADLSGDPVSDPFRIEGPAVVSFSGGRTSAYMLWRILQAHGGTLPANVVCLFQNTGREMPATLDFVRDCGAAWNVPIRWLEYRWAPGGPSYVEVSHNSASRDGEPFEMLTRARSMLPNPTMRFCTEELKIRTSYRFIRDQFGWRKWTAAVGLRADESVRVERIMARNGTHKNADTVVCPLFDAGVQQMDVWKFWRSQPFDLRLAGSWEGNCDGCFLKNRGAIMRMHKDHPERMTWWAMIEASRAGTTRKPEMAKFRANREDYATLARLSRDQGAMDFEHASDLPCLEAACGV